MSTKLKPTTEAHVDALPSLEEAMRLKAAAAKLRLKADESKLCIDVAQQTVTRAMITAAKDEKAALDAEELYRQAGIDARLRMEHELNMPHADVVERAPAPVPATLSV